MPASPSNIIAGDDVGLIYKVIYKVEAPASLTYTNN